MSKILNCGKAKSRDELIRFSYLCPQKWESLQATDNESVRLCHECRENVIHCTSKKQAEASARQGYSFAIDNQTVRLVDDEFDESSLQFFSKKQSSLGLKSKRAWGKHIFDRQKQQLLQAIRDRSLNIGENIADINYKDLSHLDLSRVDLSHKNLSGFDFSNSNLSYANLSYSNLTQANLNQANLSNSNLSHADLSKANLTNVDLKYADLSGIDLTDFFHDLTHYLSNRDHKPPFRRVLLEGVILDLKYQAANLHLQATFHTSQNRSELFHRAFLIRRELGDRSGEIQTLIEFAYFYLQQGKEQQALELYQQALAIAQEVGDRSGEADILTEFGCCYLDQGAEIKAMEYFRQALSITQKIGDPAQQLHLLSQLGRYYYEQEAKQQSLNYYQQALPIFNQLNNFPSIATSVLRDLTYLCRELGKTQLLGQCYQYELLNVQQTSDQLCWYGSRNREREISILDQLATIYLELGNKHQVLNYLQQKLSLIRPIIYCRSGTPWLDIEIETLEAIVNLNHSLKINPCFLRRDAQLLVKKKSTIKSKQEVLYLARKGLQQRLRGEREASLHCYNQALSLTKEIRRDRHGKWALQALILPNIGRIYEYQGEPHQALDHYYQALHLRKRLKDFSEANELRRQIKQLENDYRIDSHKLPNLMEQPARDRKSINTFL
ncbi:MAG: tetratricopeptide repeat protein [Cyanobacteria bacterium P01_E01_bin.35]